MGRRWRAARPARRVIAAAAAVLVLGGVAVGIWWFTGRDGTATPTTTTVAASLTTLEKSVVASGTLTPTVQESVGFEVSGTVTSVAVAAGDTVTAGQVLATVDTLELEADLLAAKADLATAEATLANAEDADDGSDAAQAQVDAAAARVEVAKAAVAAAEEAMAGATLVSPAAGLVTSVGLEVGDRVGSSSGSSGSAEGAAGGSTGDTSTGQVVIVGTDAYQVELSVDDADVALIAAGDQVELTSDDLDGTVFGVVRSIGLLSTSTGVAAYPVAVDVTGDTSALHDGIAVDAAIIYERRTDVLTVPSAAVTTNADGTTTVTKVEADGTTSTVAVTTGETSGTVTEITSGLAEGDQVQVVSYARGGGTTGGDEQEQGQLPGGQLPGGEMVFPGGEAVPGGQLPDFSDRVGQMGQTGRLGNG